MLNTLLNLPLRGGTITLQNICRRNFVYKEEVTTVKEKGRGVRLEDIFRQSE